MIFSAQVLDGQMFSNKDFSSYSLGKGDKGGNGIG